jgi:hypothetical protein
VQGAPATTNGTFTSLGTVNGSVQCLLTTLPGTVTGGVTILSLPVAMPPSGVESMYVSLGTSINGAGTTLDRIVLSPALNPWGSPNSDGVYVLSTSNDVTIRRCRILGTLVVVCPGHTVKIDMPVLMQPARPDYPVLIVDGNLDLEYDASGGLSESANGTNYNPVGAPYQNVTDSDTADTYASEIDGLVHIKGTIIMNMAPLFRGAIICESGALTNAIDVSGTPTVVYDPTLYSSPPMGYTKSVTMSIQAGSYRQVVLP